MALEAGHALALGPPSWVHIRPLPFDAQMLPADLCPPEVLIRLDASSGQWSRKSDKQCEA